VNLSGGEYTPSALPGVLGKDYVYPLSGVTTSLYPTGYQGPAYFRTKGLRLLRIPVRWERLQPTPFGPLTTADVAALRRLLDEAAARQQQVILELHNFGSYYTTKLTPSHASQFADVWQKLAATFVGHPGLYGYELMNEPGDLPGGSTTWKILAQAGLDGVRRADRSAWVLIPGYHWQKASTWRSYNEDLLLRDPANKLLYAAHLYFDWDATGFHRYSYDAGGAYPTIGIDRLQPFIDWLTDHQLQGILTEYGVVDHDPRWLTVLDNFLRKVDSEPRLVGALAWAAGPLWGTPRDLGLDPLNGKDQPQMQVIAAYAGGSIAPGVRRSALPPSDQPRLATGAGRVIDVACQVIGRPDDCVIRWAILTGWSRLSDWAAHVPFVPVGVPAN
jgi:endoglucanase